MEYGLGNELANASKPVGQVSQLAQVVSLPGEPFCATDVVTLTGTGAGFWTM